VSLGNAAPLSKRDQVVTVHDAAVFANPRAFSLPFRVWYGVLLTGLGRVARAVITVSSFSEGELRRYCRIAEAKMRVTYPGKEHVSAVAADGEILWRHGLGRKPFVLAASSMSPNKNFRSVVRAVELLGDAADFEVAIAGGANPKIFGRPEELLPGSVKYLGYVSDGELRALYENAACFVFPSFYEGFGLPPLEAMALGCPVVASYAASMPEVCGDAVLYCDPHDPADLAGQIRRLVGDEDLREDLSRRGLERAERFSWDRCARETLAVIEEASRARAR
jgi:glycosyltransferase involved in cell wall biosynthesis